MSNNSTNVIANNAYSSPEKVDAKLKIILQRDQRNNKFIKTLPFDYIKSLIDISLLFKDNDTPQGFENPVKSIAKLKYIVLKRQFDSNKESELLIKIRTLQAFEKVKPAVLDKEVVRLYKKYAVPIKMAKIQRKTKKAENKAKKEAAKEASRAASRKASGKSYSKFFKGSESNSSSSSNSNSSNNNSSSKSSWSPNYERNNSSSNNDEVIIDRTGIHTKKQRRSHNSYNSE